jgi:AraC-like DNA-binding protein
VPLTVEEPARVVALALDPVQRARVADAVRATAHVVSVPTPDELYAALRASLDPVDLVVLGTATGDVGLADVVRRIRRERPLVPVVVYLGSSADQSSTIPKITGAGVHEIIVPGYNDERMLLKAAILTARRFCAAGWVLGKLAACIPARLLGLAEATIADPVRVDSVPALATSVGVHRKTLYNWCRMTRFFGPADLVLWCRLALVAHYLGATTCSIDVIARDLGYPSDTALRNTLKRRTGLTATELRERGGLDAFLEILNARVREHRQLLSRRDEANAELPPE